MGTLKKIEKDVILDRVLGSAIIIRPGTKFSRWLINHQGVLMQLVPSKRKTTLSLEEIQQDVRVFVVTEDDNIETAADLLKIRYQEIFESYLTNWCPTKTLWPNKRNLETFAEYFEIQYFQDPYVLPKLKEEELISFSLKKSDNGIKKMSGSYVIMYPNSNFVEQSGRQPSVDRLSSGFIPIFIPNAETPQDAAKYLAAHYQEIFTEELLLTKENFDRWEKNLDYKTFLKVFNTVYCHEIYALSEKLT